MGACMSAYYLHKYRAAAAADSRAQHAENAEQGDEYGLVLSADGGKMTFYIRSPLAEKLPLLLAGGSPPQAISYLWSGPDQLEQELQPLEQLTAAGTSGPDADQQEQPQGIVVKADVMAVCLIKPVADGPAVISEEELQAKVSWGVRAVKATGTKLTGAGVKVALLDTGLDINYQRHPAFQGVNVVFKDFTTGDEAATHDGNGHGTHCLGTILGRPVDGMRIGVAPGITDVLVAKVVPDGATGTSAMLVDAILWAWQEGANIINISLAIDLVSRQDQLVLQGTPRQKAASEAQKMLADNLMLLQCLMAMLKQGSAARSPPLVIAACGNGSKKHAYLPASAQGVLSVAAAEKTSQGLQIASFSNQGAKVCAPGVAVCSAERLSTVSGAPLLTVLSGTSMAAPHVAGVAALWWEQARIKRVPIPKDEIAEWVATQLSASATDTVFALGADRAAMGWGLVQAPAE